MISDAWLLEQLDRGNLVVRGKLLEDPRRSARLEAMVHLFTAHIDDDGAVYGSSTYCYGVLGAPWLDIRIGPAGSRGEVLEWMGRTIHDLWLTSEAPWQAAEESLVFFQPQRGPGTTLKVEDAYLATHFARMHGMVLQTIHAGGSEPKRAFLHTLSHRLDGLIHRAVPVQYGR